MFRLFLTSHKIFPVHAIWIPYAQITWEIFSSSAFPSVQLNAVFDFTEMRILSSLCKNDALYLLKSIVVKVQQKSNESVICRFEQL